MSGECEECGEHCLEDRCNMAAAKGNCYNPAGRPEKEIDWTVFEEACSIFCTQEEMEGLLHVDRDTLMTRVKKKYGEDYSAVYKKFSANGKQSLRRHQLKLAKKNAAMAIWMGKNYLDQKDTPSENNASDDLSKHFIELMMQLTSLQLQKKELPNHQTPQSTPQSNES